MKWEPTQWCLFDDDTDDARAMIDAEGDVFTVAVWDEEGRQHSVTDDDKPFARLNLALAAAEYALRKLEAGT